MKKVVLIALFILCCTLCACGKNGKPDAAPTPSPSPTATPSPTPTPSPVPKPQWTYEYDLNTSYQTIDGFGAGYTWYAELATNHHFKEEIYDLLFKDAGLTILRFKNEYGYSSFENSLATNRAFYEAASKRAAERGETVQVLYSSWSPEGALKSNGSIKGGGSLKKNAKGQYCYDEFGQWWTDSVKAYREAGIPVDFVSIQNEADYKVDYDGCEFDSKENETNAEYSKAFLATYRSFCKEFADDAPKMIGPETMTCQGGAIQQYLAGVVAEAPESIYAVAHHLYQGGDSVEGSATSRSLCKYDTFSTNLKILKSYAQEHNYKLWQTEFYRGNALETANMINNCLTLENANAYIFWGGVWLYSKDNLTSTTLIPCGVYSELAPNSKAYIVTGDYYVLRHFSEFIRPGYIRVADKLTHIDNEIMTDVRSSSYVSPDGTRLVIVLMNNGKKPQQLQLQASDFTGGSQVIQSVLTDGYTSDMLYQSLGSLQADIPLELPASSVTTIVLDR